ncbi:hypothetical protein THAOC_32185 [Thalassiosira oceanica]|uniref:Methyltransferase FkbM domain-containing protein n=1 Tax=Thalassiosira oceanica TaxID=159749 RepID=K0RQI7_THAOC|nr:hypothetical protein THAOC_32185 [Thalassiosira oceanica]|mmetsp:Transcript_34101/g.81616  ORF Transcript_34101/g.81616 Transcript_34101/m.81616 type:complete len:422 (-) Transcript_34101:62-1327(-)|eukprot:EJK48977.1 hypothetical protein THAOC_32185 [Thalassiosira oceanica]
MATRRWTLRLSLLLNLGLILHTLHTSTKISSSISSPALQSLSNDAKGNKSEHVEKTPTIDYLERTRLTLSGASGDTAADSAFECPTSHVIDDDMNHANHPQCSRMLSAFYSKNITLKACDRVTGTYNPYGWECRLKQPLFDEIMNANMQQCAFGFMDVGALIGDWIVAESLLFDSMKSVAVEAHPQTYLAMKRYLQVNGIDGVRSHSYPFAVGDASMDQISVSGASDLVSWSDGIFRINNWVPSLCIETSVENTGTFKASDGMGSTSSCPPAQLALPITTIDMIMTNWQARRGTKSPPDKLAYGGLFAFKLDIEGSERDALRGANLSFSDPEQRPCIIYIELKTDEKYTQAFEMLIELGYTDIMDMDSGRKGRESYPPLGAKYPGEGNYELRLDSSVYQDCVERVREVACTDTSSGRKGSI